MANKYYVKWIKDINGHIDSGGVLWINNKRFWTEFSDVNKAYRYKEDEEIFYTKAELVVEDA